MSKQGIRFSRQKFYAPELVGLIGEELTIRFMPHDTRQVHVFRDGDFVCTAYPQDTLTSDERDQLIRERREEQRKAASIRRRASRRQAVRLAPLTRPGEPTVVSNVRRDEARREGLLRSDRSAVREGSLDLIDLGELDAPVPDQMNTSETAGGHEH